MNMKNNALKLSLAGILSALAIISFLIESLFPPLIIPGARLGISNIFIILSLLLLGRTYAIAVLIVKITLGSLLSGNVSSMLYSLPAGLISICAEILLLSFAKRFSLIAISVVGAVINTTVQNTVFCLITGATEYFIYLPYLALTGIIAGLAVGFAVYLIIKLLPKTLTNKLTQTQTVKED